jgi:hypothetical protein
MPRSTRKKGDDRQLKVVAERREAIDYDLLATALFCWIIDKVRAEHQAGKPARTEQQGGAGS